MKKADLIKIVASSALVLLISGRFIRTCEQTALSNNAAVCFASDDEIVHDALNHIKELFDQKSGSPTKASCIYKINGQTPISAVAKVYYGNDYHKKPDTLSKFFLDKNSDLAEDRTIKITYATYDKKTVGLMEEGINGKRKIEIEIPAILQI